MPGQPETRPATRSATGRGGAAGRRPAEAKARRASSFSSRLILLAFIPLGLYTIYALAERSVQSHRLRQELAVLRSETEAEKRENLRLQHELVEARSDQQVEDAARQHLNLLRPGDNAVVVTGLPPRPTPTPRPAVRPEPPERLPDWLTWLVDRLGL